MKIIIIWNMHNKIKNIFKVPQEPLKSSKKYLVKVV